MRRLARAPPTCRTRLRLTFTRMALSDELEGLARARASADVARCRRAASRARAARAGRRAPRPPAGSGAWRRRGACAARRRRPRRRARPRDEDSRLRGASRGVVLAREAHGERVEVGAERAPARRSSPRRAPCPSRRTDRARSRPVAPRALARGAPRSPGACAPGTSGSRARARDRDRRGRRRRAVVRGDRLAAARAPTSSAVGELAATSLVARRLRRRRRRG